MKCSVFFEAVFPEHSNPHFASLASANESSPLITSPWHGHLRAHGYARCWRNDSTRVNRCHRSVNLPRWCVMAGNAGQRVANLPLIYVHETAFPLWLNRFPISYVNWIIEPKILFLPYCRFNDSLSL